MSKTTLDPKVGASVINAAMDRVIDQYFDSKEPYNPTIVADEAIKQNPGLEAHRQQLERQASDWLTTLWGPHVLSNEAESIKSCDPSTMTAEQQEAALCRLKEIEIALLSAAQDMDW